MNLSIIIPAFNEEESIKPLVNLIFKNLDKNLEDFIPLNRRKNVDFK